MTTTHKCPSLTADASAQTAHVAVVPVVVGEFGVSQRGFCVIVDALLRQHAGVRAVGVA